ncbi:MAG: DUF1573 domain-containing protein [Bacteroidaceae bacterium]|nr:DUF1573 domain-containing protein [Bacteroidaceae bacterium]
MRKIVTLMMCVWILASCQESREKAMLRLVNEWNGKEIKFPSRSVFTIQGKDTVDFEFGNADYKVVTYIDSVGCTSCKLQLPRWKQLVEEVDSLTNGSVPFLFYFHPKDIKELRFLTRREAFTYPVCFDEKDDFNRLNRFPGEMMFQTFLLDKEDRVVALGNPILSPKVKELYLNLIGGNENTASHDKLTTISFDATKVDFGNFPKEKKQERSFILTNTGKGLLVIQDIITSCGCTKVEYSKEPVRPGETGKVKVIYEAEESGYFNKVITIFCNVKKSPLRLRLEGKAE